MADRNRTNDTSEQAKAHKKTPRSAAGLRQGDLASDIQGRNKLQGNDPAGRAQPASPAAEGGRRHRPPSGRRGEQGVTRPPSRHRR